MSRNKNHHYHKLPGVLVDYCASRGLDFYNYSPYHMRIDDGGYTTIDIWTTGRYYVKHTDYSELTDKSIIERGGESGMLPHITDAPELSKWLDKLFYAADVEGTL